MVDSKEKYKFGLGVKGYYQFNQAINRDWNTWEGWP